MSGFESTSNTHAQKGEDTSMPKAISRVVVEKPSRGRAKRPKVIKHRAVWCDIASTGLIGRALRPAKSKPGDLYGGGSMLEIALAVIDDRPAGDLRVIDSIEVVLHFDVATGPALNPWVIKSHTESGLFAECALSKMTPRKTDRVLVEWLQKVTRLDKPTGIRLAGNSIHFDREWIREHLPKFAACLHHRVFDVTSVQETAEAWMPGFEVYKGKVHRAMPDILESVEALRRWRQAVGL
jgi:oligoribonuclease